MGFELTTRERRWLNIVLVLAAVTLAFVVLGFLANLLAAFGDLILVFFLAWLLAFMLSPLVARISGIPFLGRTFAVVLVYLGLFGGLVIVIVASAAALASSVADFLTSVEKSAAGVLNVSAAFRQAGSGDKGQLVNAA